MIYQNGDERKKTTAKTVGTAAAGSEINIANDTASFDEFFSWCVWCVLSVCVCSVCVCVCVCVCVRQNLAQ